MYWQPLFKKQTNKASFIQEARWERTGRAWQAAWRACSVTKLPVKEVSGEGEKGVKLKAIEEVEMAGQTLVTDYSILRFLVHTNGSEAVLVRQIKNIKAVADSAIYF